MDARSCTYVRTPLALPRPSSFLLPVLASETLPHNKPSLPWSRALTRAQLLHVCHHAMLPCSHAPMLPCSHAASRARHAARTSACSPHSPPVLKRGLGPQLEFLIEDCNSSCDLMIGVHCRSLAAAATAATTPHMRSLQADAQYAQVAAAEQPACFNLHERARTCMFDCSRSALASADDSAAGKGKRSPGDKVGILLDAQCLSVLAAPKPLLCG